MLNELLKNLGFGDKEIQVYLTVLQNGKISPSTVAKLTKINRTTVYSIAKELSQKGVIRQDLGSKTANLLALPPDEWATLVTKEEKKLADKKQLINTTIDELKQFASHTKYSIPKIVFIEEEELEQYLYKQAPLWNASIRDADGIWWGFQDQHFVRYYEEWIDWYWQGCPSSKTINLRLLSNQSAEALKTKKFPRRKIRFWKHGQDFTATTWICGDYVIMIVANQRPHYLVEIHDAMLAHNLRQIFKGIWEGIE